jgi:molybdopterin synthase sulfur carrier subunit
MARVVLSGSLVTLAGGRTALDVPAANVRQLMRALEAQYPALGPELRSGMAIAIDGEIVQDALLEPLGPDTEVHFLPAIGGG